MPKLVLRSEVSLGSSGSNTDDESIATNPSISIFVSRSKDSLESSNSDTDDESMATIELNIT